VKAYGHEEEEEEEDGDADEISRECRAPSSKVENEIRVREKNGFRKVRGRGVGGKVGFQPAESVASREKWRPH